MKPLRTVIALAITAAAVRLLPLQWLHPLNWDEVEFFRATLWVSEGRVPFRDFWEHHTPLQWFVFAPFAAMTDSVGVGAVIALRWAQIPAWIATFWLMNVWMRNAGIEAFARWTAMAMALASSLFMIPAVEYRPDVLATLLYVAGLVLAQRGSMGLAGAAFCLSAFANLRMAPLIAVTVLILVIRRRNAWIIAGGLAALAACMTYFAATGTIDDLYDSVVRQNYLADKHSIPAGPMFVHRMLVPFGVRILGAAQLFDPAIVDPGGIAVLVLMVAGFAFAIRRWRDDVFVIALVAAVNLVFVALMKFIFVYHFMTAVVLALPLMALVIARMPVRVAIAIAAIAWSVNLYASVLRGKELDLAYQDRIMRELHARSLPSETVWSGGPWPLRRASPYRIWFLHEIARALLKLGEIEPYRVQDPPAVVVFDHNTHGWLAVAQRELAPYFVRHYTPVWRNLWVPGMNARVAPGRSQEWIVPRDGVYRLFAHESLAEHLWFREPLAISAFDQRNARERLELRLPSQPISHPALEWTIDGKAAAFDTIALRKGVRVAAINRGSAPIGLFLLQSNDAVLFRQPPPGVTLEAASTRVTHVPRLGARIE